MIWCGIEHCGLGFAAGSGFRGEGTWCSQSDSGFNDLMLQVGKPSAEENTGSRSVEAIFRLGRRVHGGSD